MQRFGLKNIDGDVKKISKMFSDKIKKLKFKTPILLISGGETTVKVTGKGKGGRNQEFALYFAKQMKKIIHQKNFLFYQQELMDVMVPLMQLAEL